MIFNFFIEFFCVCALEQQLEVKLVDNCCSGASTMPVICMSFSEISVGIFSVETSKLYPL